MRILGSVGYIALRTMRKRWRASEEKFGKVKGTDEFE